MHFVKSLSIKAAPYKEQFNFDFNVEHAAASGIVLIRITRGPFSRRGGLNIRRQVTLSTVFLHKRQSAAPARRHARTGKVNVYTIRLANVIR